MRERALDYISRNKETGVTFNDIAFNEFPGFEEIPTQHQQTFTDMMQELKTSGIIRVENEIYYPNEKAFFAEKALELFLQYGEQEEVDMMEITDILYQFRHLSDDEDYIPNNFELHVTITDDESSYRDMNSKVVLFMDGLPIYTTLFVNLMEFNNGFYRGVNTDTLLEIFKAIEDKIDKIPDVLIEVSGGVAEISYHPINVAVEIKDYDNEEE